MCGEISIVDLSRGAVDGLIDRQMQFFQQLQVVLVVFGAEIQFDGVFAVVADGQTVAELITRHQGRHVGKEVVLVGDQLAGVTIVGDGKQLFVAVTVLTIFIILVFFISDDLGVAPRFSAFEVGFEVFGLDGVDTDVQPDIVIFSFLGEIVRDVKFRENIDVVVGREDFGVIPIAVVSQLPVFAHVERSFVQFICVAECQLCADIAIGAFVVNTRDLRDDHARNKIDGLVFRVGNLFAVANLVFFQADVNYAEFEVVGN